MTEADETILALHQKIGALEKQVSLMQVHRDDGELNACSLSVAQLIEDQFAMHHVGGRAQRLAKCQIIVREAFREMLIGERDWRAWRAWKQSFAPHIEEPEGQEP